MIKTTDKMESAMVTNTWLKELANCEKVMDDEEVDALGWIANQITEADGNVSGDEVDEDLEAERRRLNNILGLPVDTYSLTRIKPNLPDNTNYGIRSGITHMNGDQFSTFSRGLQGAAIAIAGFATTALLKASAWNESVIDQIIKDGDTWFCESYGYLKTSDRRLLTVLDLRRSLCIQKKKIVDLGIDEAAYTGLFRSHKATEMHLIKALKLFFETYDAAVLTSSVLNISIWREGKFFNVFDAQPRLDNLIPDKSRGSVKLMLLRDLEGVVFIILGKSHVANEHFVLHPLWIKAVIPIDLDDPEEPEKSVGRPERRPSGYKIQGNFRAVVRSSFHIDHPKVPKALQSRAHLIVALAALVYSRLVNARKWTTSIVDLIFNQAHIYIVDLARVLEIKFDENFDLKIDDLLGDIFLGVYAAKLKIQGNVVPGQAKKGKTNFESGIRDFFKENTSGVLEIKKVFYAVWKDSDKYYFLDPFACDYEGFRVDPNDEEDHVRFLNATGCVTMNSSINEMIETILENTGNTEKDPFFIHGVYVLYVKTGSDGSDEKIIYREKKTNRRPVEVPPPPPKLPDYCVTKMDMFPKLRTNSAKTKDADNQYPDLMENIQDFMMKEEEFINNDNEELDIVESYKIINPHRLILHASYNCTDNSFDEIFRGRQGLSMALSAIAFAKLKHPSNWRNVDLDRVINSGNKAHSDLIDWIRRGSPDIKDDEEENEENDSDEEEDSEKDEEADEEEEEDESKEDIEPISNKNLGKIPNHIEFSMLPRKLKFDENNVKFKLKSSIIEGDADPIVNLGEALEQYLKKYDELILENNRLMYAIWRNNGNYYTFNPYGGDEEGWRYPSYPASFVVTDTIHELIDLFHGVLEFNDRKFYIHFIHVETLTGPNGKYIAPINVELPDNEVEKYQTVFLPLTDADVFAMKPKVEEIIHDEEKNDDEDDEDEEESVKEEEEEEEEDEDADGSKEDDEEKSVSEMRISEELIKEEPEQALEDPLLEIEEHDRPDAPIQLNLFLLTTTVKLEDEIINQKAKEGLEYERLKYNHPPPYVQPPKKVLAMLLAAKKASKSIPSLVSCFSIDSKLAIKPHHPLDDTLELPAIETIDNGDFSSKLIKLPPKKYLFSRIPPIGFTPLRAINEQYIHDEELDQQQEKECRKKKLNPSNKNFYLKEVPEFPDGVRIRPSIIPLGPTIRTPAPRRRIEPCIENKKRQCRLSDDDRRDPKLEKIACYTEDILFNMLFPMPSAIGKDNENERTLAEEDVIVEEKKTSSMSMGEEELHRESIEMELIPETVGFIETEENFGIIGGNMKLDDRHSEEEYHFKSCFYAAILCILAKTVKNISEFRGSELDQLILLANKIVEKTGLLRYKEVRYFRNINLFKVRFNVILRQKIYADPENCEIDVLPQVIERYFDKNSTGILVFGNASYAFWFSNGQYYFFDPYACDKRGQVNDAGSACLLEFCEIDDMIQKIENNSGVTTDKPFRIYSLCISHVEIVEDILKSKDFMKANNNNEENNVEHDVIENFDEDEIDTEEILNLQSEESLIELSDWVCQNKKQSHFDLLKPGFSALENFNASAFEVLVVENDITRPILAPFKPPTKDSQTLQELPRRKPFDRKFNEHSILFEPIDLCIMAWSCIHEPSKWGTRTIKGIYEASQDLIFDSLLAAEDSNVSEMIDGLLTEFDVANYRFQAVFAPLHVGKLFAREGWNLAMSLKKVFETPIYTGAIVLCGKAHIGVMKKSSRLYAWWGVVGKKNIRIITSESIEDFLKLIIQEIGEKEETEFQIRVITISYAKKLDPDCSDIAGLHEEILPSSSLPQIHRKNPEPYDLDAIFKPTLPNSKPVFILGTVALDQFENLKEPNVKRCYFVALLSVMLKRDIIQSSMPSMIDKIIEIAEDLYREFEAPKYHTEHILRNVTIMNRIFEFRDVASSLFPLKENYMTGQDDFCTSVMRELKKHFHKHNDGILHFSNCCYGFWYSQSTNAYYYIDPYRCNSKGKRLIQNGSGCLGIFPTICQMVKSMSKNHSEETTGFFIHRLHVDSINAISNKVFLEDSMWIYLDYHWSFSHVPKDQSKSRKSLKKKVKNNKNNDICKDKIIDDKTLKVSSWNNFIIEIPQLIYSLWGTLGSYDERFGDHVGRNQAAICVAILAMQNLCHPSKWSPAILDSAVICGDSYYFESLKCVSRRGSKFANTFNLQSCFKVFPHVWRIEYLPKKCGILYGGNEKLSLASALKLTFEESNNVLIKCGNITVGVSKTEDGFYAADPCWTGPPLFLRNRGAIYVLRCRNFSALIYALIKMFNTNLRLEFHITPVLFEFSKEVCKTSDKQGRSMKKKIFMDPVLTKPGFVHGPRESVSGAIVVGDEDIYPVYRRNVKLGIECGDELENPIIPSPIPTLSNKRTKNYMVSTKWHKNMGQPEPRRQSSISNNSALHLVSKKTSSTMSFMKILQACDQYPKTVDFTDGKVRSTTMKQLTKRRIIPEIPPTKPLDCLPPRNFILKRNKKEFKKQIAEMSDDTYKTYKHRLKNELDKDEILPTTFKEESGDEFQEEQQ